MMTVLYPCDPKKNKDCKKDTCGVLCTMTTHKEFSTDDWKLKDLKVSCDGLYSREDMNLFHELNEEAKKHDCGGAKMVEPQESEDKNADSN